MSGRTSTAEEIELGKILLERNPGLSPWEAVKAAREQLGLGSGSLTHVNERPEGGGLAAYAEVKGVPIRDRRGGVVFNESAALNSKTGKSVAAKDRSPWLAGLLGHEILGHGGDHYLFPDMFDAEPPAEYEPASDTARLGESPHFVRGPRDSAGDSINWLVKDVRARLKTPEESAWQRILEQNEAKRRGLQMELPTEVKGPWPPKEL